jgi:CRP/FNR family transcriptional regulator
MVLFLLGRRADSAKGAAMSGLRDVRLLEEFPEADLEQLAKHLVEVTLAPNGILFWEGDPGDRMYFVRDGVLIVSKAVADGVDEVLARVGTGDVLGEMSVLDGRPRCATVRAETRARLLGLDRACFEQLIAGNPGVAALFFRAHARAAVARLRASDELVAETARWALESTGLELHDSAPTPGARPSPAAAVSSPGRTHAVA